MNEKRINAPLAHGIGWVLVGDKRYTKAVYVEEDNCGFLVNPNAILNINTTASCNAFCFFCHNRRTFMRIGEYIDADAPSLQRCIDFARRAGISRVALTGGEPTLCPDKLLPLVVKVCEAGFTNIILHTNGALLNGSVAWKGKSAPLWKQLHSAGLRRVSISLADINRETNHAIMCLDTLHAVQSALVAMRETDMRVRLSCYINKNGIKTSRQVLDYIDWGRQHKVEWFIFRMTPFHDERDIRLMQGYVNTLMSEGYSVEYMHKKSDSYIYDLKYGNIEVSFSCVHEEEDEDAKIRRLIYMPDGITYTSWISPSSYLFADDARRLADWCTSNMSTYGSVDMSYPSLSQKPNLPELDPGAYDTDIHVHSSVSDGVLSPEAVIRAAAGQGMKRIVFTEHNSYHDNLLLLRQFALEYNLTIPFFGTELSTVFCRDRCPQLKFHLLIYAKIPEQLTFIDTLHQPEQVRNDHIIKIHSALSKQGLCDKSIEQLYMIDDTIAPTAKKTYTRTILARAVSEMTGLSIEQAKNEYIPSLTEEARYRQYLDTAHMIRLARENGCVSVLAHPGWIRPYVGTLERDESSLFLAIVELAHIGLDGIEIIHRQNNESIRSELLKLASATGCLVTGGSDYHGKKHDAFKLNGLCDARFNELSRLVDERWELYSKKREGLF